MIRSRWPIGLLILAPSILFAPLVLTGRVLYWGVPLLQFYPWQHTAAEMWKAGQWPLWNSLVGSGAPLAANLQTGAFYPLNFLHLILPTECAQTYTALLHVMLAGLFMYAYLRTLKLSSLASLVGALAFQMCGFLIARLAFFSITTAFPWIAAWLWRAEKLVGSGQWLVVSDAASQRISDKATGDTRDAMRDAWWLALAIGLGVLAGHAQTAVYGQVLIATYFGARVLALRRSLVTLSFILAFAVIIGLALAAIQLLPAAELTRESQRAGGLDSTKVLTHSFWPLRLLTLLSPDFFGNPAQNNFWGYDNYWENAAYIGVLPLLLALWVTWRRITDRRRGASQLPIGFFALAALISLVLAFGWFTPIYPFLFQTVPGFALFQGPARWLVVTIPALCALAAFGVQRWLDEGFSRRTARRLMLFGIAIVIAGAGAVGVLSGRVATFGPATLRLGVLVVAVGWTFQSKIQNPTSQVLVALLVAADLISAHLALNPTLPADRSEERRVGQEC